MPLEPYRHIPYPSLHDLSGKFPPVDWLWPSWIPRGMLTLFGASPGVGKSFVALDLARRIIHGQPFPDGAPAPSPGADVLIVDAEGAPALLNQRAQAWGIDSSRLYLMLSPDRTGFIDLVQPGQIRLLTLMINEIRPALIVVDSLAAATSRGETSLQSARDILGGLSTLARVFNTAILVIHHLRKRTRSGAAAPSPQVSIDDLRGSSHLSAAARSVLALSLSRAPEGPAERSPSFPISPSPHHESPSLPISPSPSRGSPPLPLSPSPPQPVTRRLEVVKTNLCRHPPPLALRFEGEGVAVPTLHYSEWVEPPPPPTQLDLCARWLIDYLADADSPVKPADVVRAAVEQGFSRPTLYRARQALAGKVIDLGNSPHDPNKRWTLVPPSPDQDAHN